MKQETFTFCPFNTILYLLNLVTKYMYYFYNRYSLYNFIILALFDFRFQAHKENIMYLF